MERSVTFPADVRGVQANDNVQISRSIRNTERFKSVRLRKRVKSATKMYDAGRTSLSRVMRQSRRSTSLRYSGASSKSQSSSICAMLEELDISIDRPAGLRRYTETKRRGYHSHHNLTVNQKSVILQYKKSINFNCQYVTECDPLRDERVLLVKRYVEPVIIQRSTERSRIHFYKHVMSDYFRTKPLPQVFKNHNIRMNNLFSHDQSMSSHCSFNDEEIPKTVILSGDSGSGKSFMLQKIMLDWASGKFYHYFFDVVFLLKCEELKCVSEDMSLTELLSWSCGLTSDQISQMLQCSPQSLLLIDGLDELMFHPHIRDRSQPADPYQRAPPVEILRNLLNGHILPTSFLLVTTRTAATHTVKNLLKGPQRFIEIIGFSESGVEEYFRKIFQDESLFKKAYECVKANEYLQIACSVPLMCWIVCFCLKYLPNGENVMGELETTTSIYAHFVSVLVEHHCEKPFVPKLLKKYGQLAEKCMLNQESLFDERTMSETGLDVDGSLFLHKELLNKEGVHKMLVFKFMHLCFQELFCALHYILINEADKKHHPFFERDELFYPAILFLCGLSNNQMSSSLELFQPNLTFPQSIREDLKNIILHVLRKNLYLTRIFALRCLFELHDDEFVRKALEAYRSMDFSYASLKMTDCWVLLYCLQCCTQITELNITHCDLTADKLRILQPALCVCESMRLTMDHLSDIGDFIKALSESKTLRELNIVEESDKHNTLFSTPSVSILNGEMRLDVKYNWRFASLSRVCFTCLHSAISSSDWIIIFQRFQKLSQYQQNSQECNEHVDALFSVLLSLCGLKTLELMILCLNKTWSLRILSIIQTCSSLKDICISVTGLVLEAGLALLQESLTDPHCTVTIEGKKCNKPTKPCTEDWHLTWSHSCNEEVKIHFKPNVLEELKALKVSDSESSELSLEFSELNLDSHPVCESCVDIVDSDQWVQVNPSVCKDEGESKFRISTEPGHYECTKTRMRWVCDCDVTLQYHTVDGRSLIAELERLQYERIGPVIDVTVISGKLKEAHLPHYACLAESDPSLKDAVKVLSQKDEGVVLHPVELTRFHAKIVQPSFSITTLIISWLMQWEEHCDLLLYMRCKSPLILHVYFFPLNDTCSKEKVEQNEKSSLQISHPRPNRPFRMKTPHLLEVLDASVHPIEGISFRRDIHPNFFKVKQDRDGDVEMTLIREEDRTTVWKATIWKNELPRQIKNEPQRHCDIDTDQFVLNHWSNLVQGVKCVKSIADKLREQKIIKDELYSQITHMNLTSQDSMRKICSVVDSGSRLVKDKFISILQEEEPDLYKELMS
ncbi:NACHT, LRR and PYD domains-containing protein 1 homolog isoform X1 [Misgurnus anguillicaudatus]|uniref:NACHT, LRR and PYD domains-containing protein 1 homolog isoform X1 n=2 Tax=Misgurnus anguillicaudatus TaxID=75329 RepID=UPI003CCF7BEA